MKIQNRKLGGLELLFYTWDQSDPKHFLVAAELDGYTSVKNWRKGLSLLQQRHPMLNVGISADTENDLVFKPYADRTIPLEIIDYCSSLDAKLELEKELARRIDTSLGPLARVKLFQNAEKCFIIFCVHHSVADGMSVIFLLNDLLKTVTGAVLEGLPELSSMDDILNLTIPDQGKKIAEQIKPHFLKKFDYIKKEPNPEIDLLTFSKELTARLILKAKQENTTIHGTLQAAAKKALIHFSKEHLSEINIMSPISPRDLLGVTENCGLYTMASTVTFSTSENSGFWELSRYAKKELAGLATLETLQNYTNQTNQLVANVDDLTEFMEANLKIDVMLSNLGRFPFNPDYESLKISKMYGPMIISGSGRKQAIGAITVNGELSLTNSSRYLIVGFLEYMHNILNEACN